VHNVFRLCLILVLGCSASLAAAQQTTPPQPDQSTSEDQTFRSVPPAPPPPRRSESSRPRTHKPQAAPKHRSAAIRHHSTASAHARTTHHAADRHTKRKAEGPKVHLSKREIKDQRYCKALSRKAMMRNGKCRALENKQKPLRKADAHSKRPMTKQDKRDERRCASLSLREVMRSSTCRKVAQQQLDTHRETHRTVKAKSHKATKRHRR
jgi:hypothetical protein